MLWFRYQDYNLGLGWMGEVSVTIQVWWDKICTGYLLISFHITIVDLDSVYIDLPSHSDLFGL